MNEISGDGSSLIKKVTESKISTQNVCEPFFCILDDKNRVIDSLKQQIENQKMQLTFYLSQRMSDSNIDELAETCSPRASDESMPVSLALYKYYKETGMKTKLMQIYDRMCFVDTKLSKSLTDQEFFLRKIINRLYGIVCNRNVTASESDIEFNKFFADNLNVSLFSDLLKATLNLQKRILGFQICCQRLLTVEEERSSIVEQVYSMPPDQRTHSNYLLGIKMENMQLEQELKRILRRHQCQKDRLNELNVIESVVANLQNELKCLKNRDNESHVSHLLEKINTDAKLLLQMTKSKLGKNSKDTSTEVLERMFDIIGMALNNCDNNTDDNPTNLRSEIEHKIYDYTKMEVGKFKNRIFEEFQHKVGDIFEENDTLKAKLSQANQKVNKIKEIAQSYKKEFQQEKFRNAAAIIRLREERDIFKSQVEDLQAIREAYAQLVDRQPSNVQIEQELAKQIDERDRKIYELEDKNELKSLEIASLNKTLNEQKAEIQLLNRFIRLTKFSERSIVCKSSDFLSNPTRFNENQSNQSKNTHRTKNVQQLTSTESLNLLRQSSVTMNFNCESLTCVKVGSKQMVNTTLSSELLQAIGNHDKSGEFQRNVSNIQGFQLKKSQNMK